jgi:hypothetical protein
MSRHIPRHARWNKRGPSEYTSGPAAVRFSKGAWWAHFSYQERDPALPADHLPVWHLHSRRLGPFKRPRNAMIAAEQEILLLKRRHGENVRFEPTPSGP